MSGVPGPGSEDLDPNTAHPGLYLFLLPYLFAYLIVRTYLPTPIYFANAPIATATDYVATAKRVPVPLSGRGAILINRRVNMVNRRALESLLLPIKKGSFKVRCYVKRVRLLWRATRL